MKILDYRMLESISQSALGKVYRAIDHVSGREVAVKIMDPLLRQSPDLRQRFFDEARILKTLSHRGIVQIFNYGIEGNIPFIVYESVSGTALNETIKSYGSMAANQALAIFRQILDVVAFAHSAGYVLLDLEPSHIIIQPDGTAKFVDFALAKGIEDSCESWCDLSLNSTARMAPEVRRGNVSTNLSADIYSLGLTLFELLAGRSPVCSAGEEINPDISAILPNIPDYLAEIMGKALNRLPNLRFQTCASFGEALENGNAEFLQTASGSKTQTDPKHRASNKAELHSRQGFGLRPIKLLIAATFASLAIIGGSLLHSEFAKDSRSAPPTTKDSLAPNTHKSLTLDSATHRPDRENTFAFSKHFLAIDDDKTDLLGPSNQRRIPNYIKPDVSVCHAQGDDACRQPAPTARVRSGDEDLPSELVKACQDGGGRECFELGLLAENVGQNANAHSRFRRACMLGESLGCCAYAAAEAERGHDRNAKFYRNIAFDRNSSDRCRT